MAEDESGPVPETLATLQVKNFPTPLRKAMLTAATAEGMTLAQWIERSAKSWMEGEVAEAVRPAMTVDDLLKLSQALDVANRIEGKGAKAGAKLRSLILRRLSHADMMERNAGRIPAMPVLTHAGGNAGNLPVSQADRDGTTGKLPVEAG